MRDFEAAWLTVRLGAITENYKEFRRLAGSAATAGVVKADAYGLGAEFVAPALKAAGCDTFFVARLEEGIALRRPSRCAHIRAGRRARRCGAGFDCPSSYPGPEFPFADRRLWRRRIRSARCRDPHRYRHEPSGSP